MFHCFFFNLLDLSEGTISTLIIGAGNYIGYQIATSLHRKQENVVLVEDYTSIELDSSKEKWFYLDKLRKEKLPVKFNELDSQKNFYNLLKHHKQTIKSVIYIVSGSYQNVHLHDFYGVPNYSQQLSSFTFLLDAILSNNDIKSTKLLLLVDMNANEELQRKAVETFSLILLSYQRSYNLDLAIVEVNKQHKRKCLPFHSIYNFTRLTRVPSCVTLEPNDKSTSVNDTAFLQSQKVLFSTYFTHNKKFYRFYRNDSFQFLKGFFMTAKKHDLKIIIYHDEASPHFQAKLKDYYSNIEFILYTGDFHSRSINDARFYIIYEYLLDHPEVDGIILQDLRDGIFYEDPFVVMELLGDYFFSGMDFPFDKMRRKGYHRCEHNFGVKYKNIPRLYPFLNAGTFGGTRHVVLGFLTLAVHLFEKLFPATKNCNMDVIDFVAHRYLYDTMFTGYPFQCCIGISLASPPGTAIRHKMTHYDA